MLLQLTLTLVVLLTFSNAVKPPGYQRPADVEKVYKNPPKYEYGYAIQDEKGQRQGKSEARDGIYALGRYYVQGKDNSQKVEYFSDEWGYHPYVEYRNEGPHGSRSAAQFALGEEAVKALHNSGKGVPSSEQISESFKQQITQQKQQEQQAQTSNVQIQQQEQQVVTTYQGVQPSAAPLQQVVVNHQAPPPVQYQAQQQSVVYQQEIPKQPLTVQYIGQNDLNIQNQQQQQSYSANNVVTNVVNHVQELKTVQENVDAKVNYEESLVNIENSGGYGAKLGVSAPEANYQSAKLIQNTQSLVSGQDVLNINEAIGNVEVESKVEHVTPQSIVTEYHQGLQQGAQLFEATGVTATSAGVDCSTALPIVSSTPAPTISSILEQEQREHFTFAQQPIVVQDYEENKIQSSTERAQFEVEARHEEGYSSSTQSSIESDVVKSSFGPTESTILVTPRPTVGTSFLAPITAGVQLQNAEESISVVHSAPKQQSVDVEIQKSVPYYLGKFEYIQTANGISGSGVSSSGSASESQASRAEVIANQNIELGKLLQIPIEKYTFEQQLPHVQINNQFKDIGHYEQKLPYVKINTAFQETNFLPTPSPIVQLLPHKNIQIQFQDQHQAQHIQQSVHVPVQHYQHVVEKHIGVPQPYPVEVTKYVEKPVHVTKYVDKPYPVHIPYPVEKRVPVPYPVERVVEKPVTKYVEKLVRVPQPYPVEKIVEKEVKVPYEVTKYVDKPYPVQVPVPHPVPYPVEVEKIVEKIVQQPYPVEVRVPVHVPVEVKVPHEVTRYVEKKVPVTHIVEKPVPVEKIVEKPVPHYIEKPYPVHVKVPVAQPYAVPVQIPQPYPVEVPKYITKTYGVPQPYPVPIKIPYQVTKLISVPVEVPKYVEKYVDRPYPVYVGGLSYNLPKQQHQQQVSQIKVISSNPYSYAPSYQPWKQDDCLPNQHNHQQHQQQQYQQQSIKLSVPYYPKHASHEYIGLVPPKLSSHVGHIFSLGNRKFRRYPRHNIKNFRIEYGFKPPMIPSVEIDENGKPLEKHE